MPNLSPPVTTTAAAAAYRDRIRAAVDPALGFEPLMTAYLTDSTDAAELVRGHAKGVFTAAKLYPAHATTNSSHGVTDIAALRPVLAAMERAGMPLLVHGEVTDPEIDIFDREAVFIDRVLNAVSTDFPALKIVFEHITTADAVAFVEAAGPAVAATITPHHLHINRNAIFAGGIRPHMYCLPIAKREVHRLALRRAAVSGNPKFFLGTDTAPHAIAAKEAACGCAGIFNAPFAIESYADGVRRRKARSIASKASRPNSGRAFTACRSTRDRSSSNAGRSRCLRRSLRPAHRWYPFHAGETIGWRFVGQQRWRAIVTRYEHARAC